MAFKIYKSISKKEKQKKKMQNIITSKSIPTRLIKLVLSSCYILCMEKYH